MADVSPGSQTSEFKLALPLAIGGLVLMAGAVALGMFGKAPELVPMLLKYGVLLASGSAAVYGGLRTVLKYAAIAKQYEGQAEAVAAMIPGPVGAEVRMGLALAEKAINILAVAQPVFPVAVAQMAGAVAGASASPSAAPGSPSAA